MMVLFSDTPGLSDGFSIIAQLAERHAQISLAEAEPRATVDAFREV
jgi:hypothetical protein